MAKLKHMFKKTAVLFRDREDRNQEKKSHRHRKDCGLSVRNAEKWYTGMM